MSASAPALRTSRRIKLHVDDFWLLRESGAFDGYDKAELLDGELWGVIRAPKRLGQWDDIVPILLRPIDHDLLREAGALARFAHTRLIGGVICVSE